MVDQIPNSEFDVGMSIIQGIIDKNEKKQIFFYYHKDLDFNFKNVKKLVQATFFEVGKTGTFDLKYYNLLV